MLHLGDFGVAGDRVGLGELLGEQRVVLGVRPQAVARAADLLGREDLEQRGRVGVADPIPDEHVLVGLAAGLGRQQL
jgi:hypothetical protein